MIAILLIGAPGSGKTTWGKYYAETRHYERFCPDEFRAKFGISEDDQTVSGKAFAACRAAMDNAFTLGNSVMIDATNMHRKGRSEFLKIAKKHGAYTMAIVFEATKETLMERNKTRGAGGGRNVPEDVIDRMLSKYERPIEGVEFDSVQYITKL
jgi:predicted kinase